MYFFSFTYLEMLSIEIRAPYVLGRHPVISNSQLTFEMNNNLSETVSDKLDLHEQWFPLVLFLKNILLLLFFFYHSPFLKVWLQWANKSHSLCPVELLLLEQLLNSSKSHPSPILSSQVFPLLSVASALVKPFLLANNHCHLVPASATPRPLQLLSWVKRQRKTGKSSWWHWSQSLRLADWFKLHLIA